MKGTYEYAAVTKDEAQRRRWTFYEAVKLGRKDRSRSTLKEIMTRLAARGDLFS
jgi:hypothetical protein